MNGEIRTWSQCIYDSQDHHSSFRGSFALCWEVNKVLEVEFRVENNVSVRVSVFCLFSFFSYEDSVYIILIP